MLAPMDPLTSAITSMLRAIYAWVADLPSAVYAWVADVPSGLDRFAHRAPTNEDLLLIGLILLWVNNRERLRGQAYDRRMRQRDDMPKQ